MKFDINANRVIWDNFMASLSTPYQYTHTITVDRELDKFNGMYIVEFDSNHSSYIRFETQEDMIHFILRWS
jgi:hypothetical protein